jgi:hypothetical protein
MCDQTQVREAAVATMRAGGEFPMEAWPHVWLPLHVEAAGVVSAVRHVRAFWGVPVADVAEAVGLDAI